MRRGEAGGDEAGVGGGGHMGWSQVGVTWLSGEEKGGEEEEELAAEV